MILVMTPGRMPSGLLEPSTAPELPSTTMEENCGL
jgi:hypothetical protein